MPELPEVETIKEALRQAVDGAVIKEITVRCRSFRIPVPDNFENLLKGGRIAKIYRIAKYVVIDIDNGYSIVWHFGMSGRVKIAPTLPEVLDKHDHIVITTTAGYLIFNDARRFGLMICIKTPDVANYFRERHTGIDPLDDKLDGKYLAQLLQKRKTPIKTALLDQSLIAGIGNIYASEALYLAKISPLRLCSDLSEREICRLLEAVRVILRKAIAAGGSTLKDYRKPDGGMGYFQFQHNVYGKEGQKCPDCPHAACPCGGIKKIIQGGRSTYYCPHWQK